jgi:hypothetical protein
VADHIIGPHFIEYVARLTLSTIKAIVERESEATMRQRAS